MGRRHFSGKPQHKRTSLPATRTTSMSLISKFGTTVTDWWRAAHSSFNINHLVIVSVIIMVILSFVLPDISQKIQRTNEIKRMKKVLEFMTNEVTKAEVSCLTVAKDLWYLQCSMHDTATETIKEQRDFSVCTSKSIRKTQSEPIQINDKKYYGFIRRLFCFHKDSSDKKMGIEVCASQNNSKGQEEIAIMSYLYTDSFDAKKE